MITLVSAVFLASLLGGLHCVGMCGAFMALVIGEGKPFAAQLGYHGGRLITYLSLGALAGALGKALNIAGTLAGIEPIALSLSAIVITLMGVLTWLRLRGVQVRSIRGPKWVKTITAAGYRFAMKRPPVQRAMIVGLLTTLLPCGWLWTFLITAAGTANPAHSTLVMLVFWLGTLPAMAAVGVGLRGMLGALQQRVPTLTCLVMIGIGLFTLAGRWRLDPLAWANKPAATAAHPSKAPCCETNHVDAN